MSNEIFPLRAAGAFIDSRKPSWSANTKMALSGKRISSTWALEPLVSYAIKQGVLRSVAQLEYQQLLSFIGRHFATLDSFLLDDLEDNTAADPSVQGGGMCFGLGTGSQTAFQLQRRPLGTVYDNLTGGPWRSSSGPRTNFLLWSSDLTNAAWTKSTGVIAAANGALAPDPASSAGASVLIYNGTGSAGGARCSQAIAATSTTPICTSGWFRADAPVNIGLGNTAGIVSTVGLTTSWQRIDWNVTPAVGGDVGLVIYSPAAVNTAFRIYFWGGQSEPDVSNSGTPTKLIPTTTTALSQNPQFWPAYADSFLPVYEFNGAPSIFRQDWQGVVQLLPWARTNLCLQSDSPGNGTWGKTNVSVGAGVTGPDGLTSGFPITGVTTAGGILSQSIAGLIAGQTYTASVWLRCAAGGALTLGTSGGSTPLTVTATWQRFTRTFTAASTTTVLSLGAWAVGEVVEFAYAQLEAGLTATSVILTLTVAISITDYTLVLGVVTLSVAPLAGAILSWLGSYYIRVRLDDSASSGLDLQRVVKSLWSANGLQLISVIP